MSDFDVPQPKKHLLRSLIIWGIFIFIVLLILLPRIFPPSEPSVKKMGVATFHFREYGKFNEVMVNVTWLDKPLSNVSVTLFENEWTWAKGGRMREISVQVTNETGIAHFSIEKDGEYMLKLEYWAYFKQGGVEIVKNWILFTGKQGTDQHELLNIDIHMSPMKWPDEPEAG